MIAASKLFSAYLKMDAEQRAEFDRTVRSHMATINEPAETEWVTLGKAYKKEWDRRTRSDWQGFGANQRALHDAALQIFSDARARNLDPVAQCTAVIRGFFADAFAKSTGYACGGLAKNPLKYLESRAPTEEGPGPITKLEMRLDDARQRGDHEGAAAIRAEIDRLVEERRRGK